MYQEITGKKIQAFVNERGSVVFRVLGNDDKWRVFQTTNVLDSIGTPVFRTAKDDLVNWDTANQTTLASRTARRHVKALKTNSNLKALK